MKRPVDRNAMILRAKAFRRSPTVPEGLLWDALKARPGKLKFRRQHAFEFYIANFYCASVRLVIEIDGENHLMGDRPQRDARRDRWMRERGIRVIRFEANQVLKDLDSVLSAIVAEAGRLLPLHQAAPGPPPHDGVTGRN